MNANDGGQVRLNKYIAARMIIGRRQADDYIAKGRVTLNGKTATLGDRLQPGQSIVKVDGQELQNLTMAQPQYLCLNKPAGYVCSRRRQGDSLTIYSLLPTELHHLKPVGRLDKDSSGLLLLTNDGDFAHRMTHPSFLKTKIYEVVLATALQPLHQQMIIDHGITLEDGVSKFMVEPLENSRYRVTMHEGRNRQIRRTFAALGYTVAALHRIQFGPYAIGSLGSGKYQPIDAR